MNNNLLYSKARRSNFIIETIAILLIANFAVFSFFSVPIVIVAIFFLFFILYNNFISKNRVIDLLFLIYIGSFFQYGIAQGGLFNIIGFIFLLIFVLNGENIKLLRNKSKTANFFLAILIISNFIGLFVKNQSSIIDIVMGSLVFLSFIFVFNVVSNINFNNRLFSTFFYISLILMLYMLLISMNKYFMIYNSKLPIFGLSSRWGSDNLAGTIGPSPVAGELGLLFLSISLPLMMAGRAILKKLHIQRKYVILSIIINILTLVLAASRSTIILSVILIGVSVLLSFFAAAKFGRNISLSNSTIVIVIIFIISVSLSSKLNLDYLLSRFELVDTSQITVESLRTGEGINRTTAFDIGSEIIERENWLLGYGWGVGQSNRAAWFKELSINRQDPHSLYLSLFPIWGWLGALAYLLLYLNLILKIFRFARRTKHNDEFIIAIALFMLYVLFLINEYKITALGFPHYFMITWIFLGLGYSFINRRHVQNDSVKI
jgi:hypothetical protein